MQCKTALLGSKPGANVYISPHTKNYGGDRPLSLESTPMLLSLRLPFRADALVQMSITCAVYTDLHRPYTDIRTIYYSLLSGSFSLSAPLTNGTTNKQNRTISWHTGQHWTTQHKEQVLLSCS